LNDVTGEALRRWRESQGWDVPRMAREIRKAAKDCGEDVAAHHGLVKMIPQWERGGRAPRERYRLLYLKIFQGALGELSRDMGLGAGAAQQISEVRARAARLPGDAEIRALEADALAKPRSTMTAAEIQALTAETISRLHDVADNLGKLSALLDDNEGSGGRS
jgi:transcriptional regulator with XRE-family HTH domain